MVIHSSMELIQIVKQYQVLISWRKFTSEHNWTDMSSKDNILHHLCKVLKM